LMGGMLGRIFREFSVTVAIAIIISGFVSLTLTPMLCARVLRHHAPDEKHAWILHKFEDAFNATLRGYESSLDWVLRGKAMVLGVTLATLVGVGLIYYYIPKGFFPPEDTGFLSGSTEGNPDIAYPEMVKLQKQLVDIVLQDPAVAYLNSRVGPTGANAAANSGRMFIALKPRNERKDSSTEVIQRLRRTANTIPGIKVTFQNVQNLNITGRPSKSQYQYTLQSSDTAALYKIAPEIQAKIAQVDGINDVESDLQIKSPQMSVEIDRERAAVYGISID